VDGAFGGRVLIRDRRPEICGDFVMRQRLRVRRIPFLPSIGFKRASIEATAPPSTTIRITSSEHRIWNPGTKRTRTSTYSAGRALFELGPGSGPNRSCSRRRR
jgi:hypothetical protein